MLGIYFEINFHILRHIVKHMDFDPSRKLLATVGQDHVIKLWNLSEVLLGEQMEGP